MKSTTFNIYKDSTGRLRLDNYTVTLQNEDWEQFLRDTGQKEKADRLLAMSSRKRSPKIYKIRKSKDYLDWQKGKTVTISSKLYGTASAEYDGRIPEQGIKSAILEAIRYGDTKAMYHPRSNEKKKPQDRVVYVFGFDFKKK